MCTYENTYIMYIAINYIKYFYVKSIFNSDFLSQNSMENMFLEIM